ncbi:hypothetical protein GKQ38_04305 [Candidatus Nanohaloarchaea archaeon]|nr:hypothetical protein GKQ38_04305 [Candidatus Nanohaloarchaea archaeon]
MIKVAKRDGTKEELDEGKLWNSLYNPAKENHYQKEEAVELADEAKERLMTWITEHEDNVVTTKELAEKVEEVLAKLDEDVALMYDKHLDIN